MLIRLGALSDLPNHLNHAYECAEEVFNCPACQLPIKNKEMNEHLANECVKRLTPCKYCSLRIVFDTLGMFELS
jgi:hypothetical protein